MNRREVLSVFGLTGIAVASGSSSASAQPKSDSHAHGTVGEMAKEMRSMNKVMVEHLGERDEEFDRRFIDLMIPHHEGAVLMARHALEHSDRPELKEMATKMIREQEKEIEQLKKWRQEWYGK